MLVHRPFRTVERHHSEALTALGHRVSIAASPREPAHRRTHVGLLFRRPPVASDPQRPRVTAVLRSASVAFSPLILTAIANVQFTVLRLVFRLRAAPHHQAAQRTA